MLTAMKARRVRMLRRRILRLRRRLEQYMSMLRTGMLLIRRVTVWPLIHDAMADIILLDRYLRLKFLT